MDRRNFLSWVSVGFLASHLAIAIAACSSAETSQDTNEISEPPPPPPGAIARDDGFIPIGPTQALELDGFLAGDLAGIAVIVAQGPNDTLIGFESTCPHQSCVVAWQSDSTVFECPCHGSTFNADGTVSSGPADVPLTSVEVTIEEDIVLAKLA